MTLQGKLVFSSGRGTDYDIWTLNLSSGSMQQLTRGQDINDFPRWSPDGSKIAFISTGSDLIASLHIMDADGSNLRRLTDNVHSQHPSWAPDGSGILFSANARNNDEIDICRCDISSGKVEILLSRKGQESEPCLSPDGKRLLFAATDPNSDLPFANRDTEIMEHDLASGRERKLCSHPARDYCPVYSPDGSKIAFVSHRNQRSEEEYRARLIEIQNGLKIKDRKSIDTAIRALQELDRDSDIYVADSNGKNIRQLTENQGADVGARWSPCGNYLVYAASPLGEIAEERIKIVEVESGKQVPLNYDREALMAEIGADPERYLNDRLFLKLVPDFIERQFRMRTIGAMFWGEEHQPDWTK